MGEIIRIIISCLYIEHPLTVTIIAVSVLSNKIDKKIATLSLAIFYNLQQLSRVEVIHFTKLKTVLEDKHEKNV